MLHLNMGLTQRCNASQVSCEGLLLGASSSFLFGASECSVLPLSEHCRIVEQRPNSLTRRVFFLFVTMCTHEAGSLRTCQEGGEAALS